MKAQSGCLPLQVSDSALVVLLLVIAFTRVGIGGSVLQHVIDDTGELMGGGGNGFGRSMLGAHPAVESTQGAMAAAEALRSDSEGQGRAAMSTASARYCTSA